MPVVTHRPIFAHSCFFLLAGAKVIFPDGAGAAIHANSIIECSWDATCEAWSYMRERHDKATPNAWRVYEKVVQSIQDNITPATLLQFIAETMSSSEMYERERARQRQAAASAGANINVSHTGSVDQVDKSVSTVAVDKQLPDSS